MWKCIFGYEWEPVKCVLVYFNSREHLKRRDGAIIIPGLVTDDE